MSEGKSTDNVDDLECNSNNKKTQTPNDIRNFDLEKKINESVEYFNTEEQDLLSYNWKERMAFYYVNPIFFFRSIWKLLPSFPWKFSWRSKSS